MVLPADLIRTIDHVGIAVPDLDDAIALHTGSFGFQVVHQEVNEEQGVREAMLAVGTGPYLQLVAPLTPESAVARFLDRSGPGMHHLAYRVADIEEAMSAVRARGMRLLYDTARRGTADSRINFVHPRDTGGVLAELVEPSVGSGSA